MTRDPREILREQGLDIYDPETHQRQKATLEMQRMMVEGWLSHVNMAPGLAPRVMVICEQDKTVPNGRLFIQVIAPARLDVDLRQFGEGKGGKMYLSPHMIESEIVQAAFGLIKGYYEHEVRESFTYKGKRVFGPHIDIAAYLEIADRTVARPH